MSIASRLARPVLSLLIGTGLYRILAKIFKATAVLGQGSNICLEEGFLPVPVHFYSAVPDLADLEQRKIWDVVSKLPGVEFREQEQAALLAELGRRFGAECRWPFEAASDPAQFYLKNQSFSFGCAASTHCMIREHKPATVIEIGSGMSSRVISAALAANGAEGSPGQHVIVDPYPGEVVRGGGIPGIKLVQSRVELLDQEFFGALQAGDILFIDSSHSVKIGGDVNFLYLDILPRLPAGVVVHIHDISFPYEYSRAYATGESFRQFWTEQYLLQAFLAFNTRFEVLLGMNYLMAEHAPLFREAFPHYLPELHPYLSGSFWMRRVA